MQRVMSQSVLNGGNGHPKTQILNFKKPQLNQKYMKDFITPPNHHIQGSNSCTNLHQTPGYGLKKSNALPRSVTPMQASLNNQRASMSTPKNTKQVRFH